MRRHRSLPLLAAAALVLAGCEGAGPTPAEVSISFDAMASRTEARRQDLESRVRELELSGAYLKGVLEGLARRRGGSTSPAATGPRSGAAPSASSLAAREAGPSGDPDARYGGTLRLALGTDPPTLDPVKVEDTTSFQVGVQVMEGLLEFDEELNLVPLLAERWEVSEDGRTYTFHLRRGVRFHHGREMVASDFVYTFARNLDPKALGVRAYLVDRILGYPAFQAMRRVGDALGKVLAREELAWDELAEHRDRLAAIDAAYLRARGHPAPAEAAALAARLVEFVDSRGQTTKRAEEEALAARVEALRVQDFLRRGLRAPDPATFVVQLEQPYAPFVWNLPMVNFAVVPREEVERLGTDFAFRPVGTGPFRFRRWEHDVVVELEAFEDYFGGRPAVDEIEYRILPDPVTRLIEYEVGNLDLVARIPDEKYEAIKAAPPGVFREIPMLHVFYLGMNPSKPPFDDVRVRRAFNHAVNKELILSKVKKGRGVVARGPLPPAFKAHDAELEGYDFDLAEAKRLLAEAGYGPGNPLRDVPFWFNTATGSDSNAKIAEVVQSDLAQVGVELELEGMAWGTYLDFVHRCEPPFFRLAWLPSHPNADGILYALFRSGSASNATCYENPEVDALVDQARGESDEARRVSLYQEAQRKIVDDAVWIPLYHATEDVLHREALRGLRLNSRGADAIRWKTVWLEG